MKQLKPAKEVCGFTNGVAYITKNATYEMKDEIHAIGGRYRRDLGWYFGDWCEKPDEKDLPLGVELVKITWEEIGNPDGSFKPEDEVKAIVESKIFPEDISEFQGKVGDRLEFFALVEAKRNFELNGEEKVCYSFRDERENSYTWFTAATSKTQFEEGDAVTIRGTVKEHKTYKNVKQTVLTRVMKRG